MDSVDEDKIIFDVAEHGDLNKIKNIIINDPEKVKIRNKVCKFLYCRSIIS
jgi:hypothetical protein